MAASVQLSLFPKCAVPGCAVYVASWGDICEDCRRDFGPMIRENDRGEPMTQERIAQRDNGIREMYAAQRVGRADGP
jgi:hypothetical protein